jgi:hypothetical protein
VILWRLGVVSNCLLYVSDCQVVLAGLMGDHAQKVQGIRVVRLGLEDLAIDRLRLWKTASLVVLERDSQAFRDSGHSIHTHEVAEN